ncbi:MAG: hypothetical protein KME06_10595 [Kastovskya adunca ATA6-11-RM4]|jgi:hypothetical protein|nr:hypothetical protein [Kastovskya adunca ATA6-11-RM4]
MKFRKALSAMGLALLLNAVSTSLPSLVSAGESQNEAPKQGIPGRRVSGGTRMVSPELGKKYEG